LVDGNKVVETEIMDLKLHLQKVITIPTAKSSRVFLMGGAKDSEGKQAINNCYEVNLRNAEKDSSPKKMITCEKLASAKLSFAAALSPDAKNIYIAGGSTGENKSTNECEVFHVSRKKWAELPSLNQPRFSASLIVCENADLYCFGGVDNDPKDPTKFSTLRSIETLSLSEEAKEWEVLKLTLPYKTSSPGAISLGHKAFVVFGGWNKTTLNKSVIVRSIENSAEYAIEESGDMASEDTFVSNGLVARSPEDREVIVFGTSHVHKFNENSKTFSLVE
jgi:N-acetylneuraminic acid mutarotase